MLKRIILPISLLIFIGTILISYDTSRLEPQTSRTPSSFFAKNCKSAITSLFSSKNVHLKEYLKGSQNYLEIQKKILNEIPLTSHEKSLVEKINVALDELTSFKGRVFRNEYLPDEILEKYEPGEIIQRQTFISTSKEWIQSFGGNTMLIIRSKNGKDVTKLSPWKEESEVLFKTNSNFKVIYKKILEIDEEFDQFEPLIFDSTEEFEEFSWLLKGAPRDSGTFSNVIVLEEL